MRTIETDRFNCTDGERAAFEAGIKLGSLFHQFIGVPIDRDNVSDIERAMTSAVSTQPHVLEAKVSIDREEMMGSLSNLGYCPLNGKMIRARVKVEINGVKCSAVLEYDRYLDYPLMWIDSLK